MPGDKHCIFMRTVFAAPEIRRDHSAGSNRTAEELASVTRGENSNVTKKEMQEALCVLTDFGILIGLIGRLVS